MGHKGGRHHMKKLNAPKAWNIQRKDSVWTTKPNPGPHPIKTSLSLITVVRDMLGYGQNRQEAEKIIKAGEILIDGKAVHEPKFPVGFMDVVSVPNKKEYYRVLYDKKGRVTLNDIDGKNAEFKLCRIDNKTVVTGGKTQLNLHDGRNIFIEKGKYRTGDTLKMEVPKQKILEHYTLGKGNVAYVIRGKHAGKTGKITEIQEGTTTRLPLVLLEKDGEKFSIPKKYAFAVGKTKPVIKI